LFTLFVVPVFYQLIATDHAKLAERARVHSLTPAPVGASLKI
jgi:hypothetical protein